jgi:hypothetical protein
MPSSHSSFVDDEKAYNKALESYNYICNFCHKRLLKEWSNSDVLNPSDEFKFMVFRTKQKFNETLIELENTEKEYKKWFK